MQTLNLKSSDLGDTLLLGATGQVGRALLSKLSSQAPTPTKLIALSRSDLDFSDFGKLESLIRQLKPRWMINAAAYTAVDLAESEPEKAKVINADLPTRLAKLCTELNASLVHYSTDYVYSGKGQKPQAEDAEISPLNIYGQTKRQGEVGIQQSGCRHLIFRTSWVYSEEGRNFVLTMLSLAPQKESLRIVADQVGAPTYSGHLAAWTLAAMLKAEKMQTFPSGIYNLCPKGETTWADFAKAIFSEARSSGHLVKVPDVVSVSTLEYGAKASRPLNSRLDCRRFESRFGITLPSWTDGLKECIQKLKEQIALPALERT